MESPSFAANQIVFARIRGHRRWPGKIYGVSETSKKATRYIVHLYGLDRLMKFNAAELHDFGDYIRNDTNKVCDLVVYVRAIEEARIDFHLSRIRSSPKEAAAAGAAKEPHFPTKTDSDSASASAVENGKPSCLLPLLRPLVKNRRTTEDAELVASQPYDGDLGELHAELKLLRYDYHIKSYASLEKVNLKKCLTYLWKLRELRPNQFVLNRNPQVLRTLQRLRKYTGDSNKWQLTSDDRKRFVHFAHKIRQLAGTILKSFADSEL